MNPQNGNLGQEISDGVRGIINELRSGLGDSGPEIVEAITNLLGDLLELFPLILGL